MEFELNVGTTHAKYRLDKYRIKHNETNQQSSYNLPADFIDYVLELGAIVKDANLEYNRKVSDGNAYVIHKDWEFKLADGILWLLGDDFKSRNNQFIASTAKNGKTQFFRGVYNELANNNKEYEWFVRLYDRNIVGSTMIFEINNDLKLITLDVKLSGTYISEITDDVEDSTEQIYHNSESNFKFSHNRIFFGAPGTGKSYKLNDEKVTLLGELDKNCERVTFHPDYSYAHFVGTYKPTIKEGSNEITYEYVPGPFMRTLVKAMESNKSGNPQLFLLIIEGNL